MMSKECLNCSKEIFGDSDFCDECNADLNNMVDANEPMDQASLVDTNVNVLFQTRKVTGKIIENDSSRLGHKIQSGEPEGTFVFWRNLGFIIILMIGIVLIST